MLVRTRRLLSAVAALSCSTFVLASEPTSEDLKAQVDALQKKVEALEAKQVSAADVDATVQRVLEDAQRRSQMMAAEGFTAGYTKGAFVIQSADGNYSFSPIAQLQLRYIGNYRNDAKVDGGGSYDDGFEVRRAKFGFQGNIFSPELTYKFLWATGRGNDVVMGKDNPTAGEVTLEEAWVRYKLNDQLAAFAGQMKDIVAKDAITSSSRQLAVDEAAATLLLVDNPCFYVQGVGATYQPVKPLRLTAIYHDGVNSQDTNFQNTNTKIYGIPTTEQFGASGRVEWMALGDNWRQYDQYTALGDKSDSLVFGAGVDYTQSSDVNATFEGLDVQFQTAAAPGLSVFGAAMGNQINPSESTGVANSFNYGFIGQVGWLFHNNWELFGRYDITIFDDSMGFDNRQVQEIAAGVNYYLSGHAAKLTFDLVYLPQGFPSEIAGVAGGLTTIGILPTNGDAEEFVVRVQFQLLL